MKVIHIISRHITRVNNCIRLDTSFSALCFVAAALAALQTAYLVPGPGETVASECLNTEQS